MLLNLADMADGEAGCVMQIDGGMGARQRLGDLGIRPGKLIAKLSAQMFRGPVVVNVDNRRVAIGFGMAKKVLVEVGR